MHGHALTFSADSFVYRILTVEMTTWFKTECFEFVSMNIKNVLINPVYSILYLLICFLAVELKKNYEYLKQL